jgi:hypothetical protein
MFRLLMSQCPGGIPYARNVKPALHPAVTHIQFLQVRQQHKGYSSLHFCKGHIHNNWSSTSGDSTVTAI